ncbi:hypothetical protein HUU40_05495 [candidate division KSB1 bacterium]|nr:hypothetical protein [candidate division KSB1 bacterium]
MFKPAPETRHLLVALLGRTPQVLTETLYALCVQKGVPISEVSAISTQEGRQAALDKLLAPHAGRFYQLQHDYPEQCRQIQFSGGRIFVAQDGLIEILSSRGLTRNSELANETSPVGIAGPAPQGADRNTLRYVCEAKHRHNKGDGHSEWSGKAEDRFRVAESRCRRVLHVVP